MIERTYAQSGDTYRSVRERAGTTSPPSQAQVFHDFERRQTVLNAAGESVSKREDQLIEDLFPTDMGICWYRPENCPPRSHSGPWYSFTFGAINDAALFVTRNNKPFVDAVQTSDESATLLYSIFEGCSIDKLMVASALERSLRFARVDVDPHLKSLKAISTAATMFRHFPYASVDVRILQRGLYNASWIRSCVGPQENQAVLNPLDDPSFALFEGLDGRIYTPAAARVLLSGASRTESIPLEPNLAEEETHEPLPSLDGLHGTPVALLPYAPSKPQAFACLAMFESGQHDIDPGQLIDVMAMSSGDSIYVSAALLTDPYDETLPGDIRGVMGNIGRPGITFLVPPKDPLIKQVSIDEWPLIERHEFDGCLSDHFQNTSLHLSFTTAETPINIGFSGGQDLEACILETLFSVYECGRWIADLNVSNLTTAKRLSRLCRCTTQHTAGSWRSNMTCIDSWLGLVDAPEDKVSLVRAHGNWQARLAASSISLALGYSTILLPNDVCWQCFDRETGVYKTHIIAIG